MLQCTDKSTEYKTNTRFWCASVKLNTIIPFYVCLLFLNIWKMNEKKNIWNEIMERTRWQIDPRVKPEITIKLNKICHRRISNMVFNTENYCCHRLNMRSLNDVRTFVSPAVFFLTRQGFFFYKRKSRQWLYQILLFWMNLKSKVKLFSRFANLNVEFKSWCLRLSIERWVLSLESCVWVSKVWV